jgi:hypothetical protein
MPFRNINVLLLLILPLLSDYTLNAGFTAALASQTKNIAEICSAAGSGGSVAAAAGGRCWGDIVLAGGTEAVACAPVGGLAGCREGGHCGMVFVIGYRCSRRFQR